MSEDHKFIDSEGGGFEGKDKSVKIWKEFFRKYPEYRNIFDEIIIKDNLVIMFGHSICSNKKLSLNGIWIAKIKDGKVVEWKVYHDDLNNRKILGIF